MIPKVVVQRNSDAIQQQGQIIQLDHQSPHHQTIQYNFLSQQLDQNQQHLIIQQPPQIKQTIYPQGQQVIPNESSLVQCSSLVKIL